MSRLLFVNTAPAGDAWVFFPEKRLTHVKVVESGGTGRLDMSMVVRYVRKGDVKVVQQVGLSKILVMREIAGWKNGLLYLDGFQMLL